MSFAIEKDLGENNAPAFLKEISGKTPVWTTREKAQLFPTEAAAQEVIDENDLRDTIVAPYDETLTY